MAPEIKENRNFPRLDLRAPLRYQVRGNLEFNNTITNDISLGGIGFSNNEFIAPQTPVVLELNILSRNLRAIARVVWSQPLPHSDRYRLGVEFLEFDPQEKNYLQDYIDMQMGKL